MPLEFESLSHGKVAFGFFNIETDLILLNHYFFFASDFCRFVSEIPDSTNEEPFEASWEVYSIEDGGDIGNLMGAIHGIDHRGFIGEVYRLFPFPREKEKFRQKTEGFKTRTIIEGLVRNYARKIPISFTIDPQRDRVAIGEFVFTRDWFRELIRYVWLGGYPRWKDNLRPGYVLSMKERIGKSRNFMFKGLRLTLTS